MPHRSAWPAPLTAAEADALRSISDEARRRVMRALARDLHLQHHIARFENRHRQMMTVGVCIDADLSGELGTWSGVGPGLARWIRETLLALAREPAAETVASAPQGSEPAGTC